MTHWQRSQINRIRNWWGDKFPLMAAEEAGELIQALSKVERSKLTPKGRYASITNTVIIEDAELRQNLIDEIGDMKITLEVLCARYNIRKEEIDKRVEEKLNQDIRQ